MPVTQWLTLGVKCKLALSLDSGSKDNNKDISDSKATHSLKHGTVNPCDTSSIGQHFQRQRQRQRHL